MRVVRLGIIALAAVTLLLGGALLFHEPLLKAAGISLDRGAPAETELQLPDGFEASAFASGLAHPRFMAVAPDGTLFVAEQGANRVVALPDEDDDGRADVMVIVGEDYDVAHSVAFTEDGSLLVAGTGTLYRVTLDDERHEVAREAILTYPPGGQHSTRTIVVAPDGSMLLSIGSSCNVCWEADAERSSVIVVPAGGGDARILMRGLRNAVGVAIDPATGAAWATNNGRDLMGDDMPPETVYRLVEGGDAGWPRCHAGTIVDPDFGDEPDPVTGLTGCDGVDDPALVYQAHAAPLGITFWRDHAIIALHGSWNRSEKVGYEVVRVPWDDGPAGAPEMLVAGFLDQETGDATGRPVGTVVGVDGALYVSDDKGGFIYRIEAND